MLSLIAQKRMQYQLEAAEAKLPEVREQMTAARGYGDFSENSEYDAAVAEFTDLTSKIANLKTTLASEVVETTYSDVVRVGSLLQIFVEESPGNFSDMGIMLFDEVGNSQFDGTISNASSMGRVIEGRSSGEYSYQDPRGRERKCRFEILPPNRMEEYLKKFPPNREETLERIFS
jgi:transcription elongation GreA/GreB family factor